MKRKFFLLLLFCITPLSAMHRYPPIPHIIVTDQEIDPKEAWNQINIQTIEPIEKQSFADLIKACKEKRDPFIILQLLTHDKKVRLYHYISAKNFYKQVAFTGYPYKNPINSLEVIMPGYLYYIFDVNDSAFYYLTNSDFFERRKENIYNFFIFLLIELLIFVEPKTTTLSTDQIIEIIKQTVSDMNQKKDAMSILRQKLRADLEQLADQPKEEILYAILQLTVDEFKTTFWSEANKPHLERIANFLSNYFAHYPRLLVNSYKNKYADIISILKYNIAFHEELLTALIQFKQTPIELIDRLKNDFADKLTDTIKDRLSQVASSSKRENVANLFKPTKAQPSATSLQIISTQLFALQQKLLTLKQMLPK